MTVESLTESVWTRLIARGAMIVTPFIVMIFSALSLSYLNLRFAEQTLAISSVVSRVDRIESAATTAVATVSGLDKRTSIVESNQASGIRAQDAISAKLDMISNQIGDLRSDSAGIKATVEVIKSRKDGP